MAKFRISQIPIVEQNRVLGVFSYRSFTRQLLAMTPAPPNPSDIDVLEFIESIPFCSPDTDIAELIPLLDEHDAVLLGSKSDVKAIVTVVDALKFFYGLSSVYVIIAEIEIAIRALIRAATSRTMLQECIRVVNALPMTKKRLPQELNEMTFGQYVLLVSQEENWRTFEAAFGGHFPYTIERLKTLTKLRNELLHFSRPATTQDYERLRSERQWLRTRADLLDARYEQVT